MAGRRKYDLFVAGKEKRTRMRSMIRTDHFLFSAVHIHRPYLVAPIIVPVGLVDKLPAVPAEICLTVVSIEGELRNIFHMAVFRLGMGALRPCFIMRASREKNDHTQHD
jgi:hypothetical protein